MRSALSLTMALALWNPVLGAGVDLDSLADRLTQEHPEIPQAAVQKALRYVRDHYVANSRYIGIINFNLPSNRKRLFLIKLSDGSVESFYVAHGEGSGGLYAEEFSDTPQSHQSSLGLFLTGEDYDGKHGRSLKLRGMEGSNNMAESRAVVIHGSDYVSDDYIAERGMAGRSWGCPAVDYRYRDHIIDVLENGAVLVAHRA